MTPRHPLFTRSEGRSLLRFSFATLLIWYLVAVLLEFLFPGLVSAGIDLDGFLWTVILLGILTTFFPPDSRKR
jgi:hypothetical protein